MYFLKTTASFDSAHFLQGYNGKCANLHGHHWVIEVEISGKHLHNDSKKRGMLIDFTDLKQIVRNLANSFDHALIYENNTLKPETESALLSENFNLIPRSSRPRAPSRPRFWRLRLKLRPF